MKITPNQVFLHGYDRYEEDTEYDVSVALGSYFVNVGWADAENPEEVDQTLLQAPSEDLEVHDSELGQG